MTAALLCRPAFAGFDGLLLSLARDGLHRNDGKDGKECLPHVYSVMVGLPERLLHRGAHRHPLFLDQLAPDRSLALVATGSSSRMKRSVASSRPLFQST